MTQCPIDYKFHLLRATSVVKHHYLVLVWYLLLLVFCSSPLRAADDYRISSISAELIEKSDAVVRKDENWLNIRGIDKATYSVHKAVTVLNNNGDK